MYIHFLREYIQIRIIHKYVFGTFYHFVKMTKYLIHLISQIETENGNQNVISILVHFYCIQVSISWCVPLNSIYRFQCTINNIKCLIGTLYKSNVYTYFYVFINYRVHVRLFELGYCSKYFKNRYL